ncbi:MAG: class I SAM-dependent methyltransferase [Opitutus sp.]|nr:class I SAM-dependent methyltransferase [Opitutus sp.]MCS6248591.1 class I SAM-dependent methyltransferase [Opitutus sp.]MCS6278611.1 class I SAM-dependent methyltransferase [Opitutus sp.]MCS6298482.1 class I SAM-dependent methyltransferase [Opitutus sp.]
MAGIDGSVSAVDHARRRFEQEGLKGDLRVGLFGQLPWPDDSFDLVVDRGSLTCVAPAGQQEAVTEIHRVLRPGGYFFHNGYSSRHLSAQLGTKLPDGRTTDITSGSLVGVGALYFSTREDIFARFSHGWEIGSFEHVVSESVALSADTSPACTHAEWRVVVRKL